MTTFAEKNIVFPDGQLNVAPLPEAVMINGFTPETRDAPGMPLPAQYLNWLFRDIYRKASRLEEKTNTLNERVIPAWMPIACPMADAPDLRGEFIRGWDDGRGVDEGRRILDAQGDAIRNITGGGIRVLKVSDGVTVPYGAFSGGLDNIGGAGSGGVPLYSVSFDASRAVPTASENRPRNIAFNYIVRAA